jgi:hypothetical protein
VTPLETRLLASIFGTLLSSQGSDAHRVPVQRTRRRGNPSNLPACFMGVKSVTRSQSGRIRARLALGGRTYSSRLPVRLRTTDRVVPAGDRTVAGRLFEGGVSSWDRPASGDALGVRPVVSVPPLRADWETVDGPRRRAQIAGAPACRQGLRGPTPLPAKAFPTPRVALRPGTCGPGAAAPRGRGGSRRDPAPARGRRPWRC